MQIGEIIRKYRKEMNLTQEEMAKRLGVTAPAVNKWENGNSLPDIMLLAPIARLLGITADTLLSFREELTEEEIRELVQEADERLKTGSFEEAFRWAKEKLEQYPNCGQLIWQMTVIFDAWRLAKEIPDSGKYDSYINDCYLRVLDSRDENLRVKAADSLFGFYTRKEQYEKAEEYLAYFSEQNPERKHRQAYIYSKTNRMEEAYQAYEELLFSEYQIINMVLGGIYQLAMEEKDIQKARLLAEKQAELAKLFEMGEYQEAAAVLDLAVAEKDAEGTLQIVEKLISGIGTLGSFRNSSLYAHMKFKNKNLNEAFVTDLRRKLLADFRDGEAFEFLRGDKRWEELVNGEG